MGIPQIFWCGKEADYNILVLEYLGNNMEELLNLCGRKFSLKTALMLADQFLAILEATHNKGFIHRDIKPENMMIGAGKRCNDMYLIDFGLSKKFYDHKTNTHIAFRDGKMMVGSIKFSSIANQKTYGIHSDHPFNDPFHPKFLRSCSFSLRGL